MTTELTAGLQSEQDIAPLCGQPCVTHVVPTRYFRWKTILDRILAACLLIPGLPIITCLVLLVRLTSRGPGIFCQKRVGQDGRIFVMYKIRTMVVDAEARTGPTWAQPNDPRTTRIGRLLRKIHLDELPQLFNVLKGDMSLVGPRPERPEIVPVLAAQIPAYMDRLTVPAGVTGLAQVNLPADTDLESVRRKLTLDLQYIESAGFWLDCRIFVYTALRLWGVPCTLAARLLGLIRQVEVPEYMRPKPSGNGAAAGDGKAATEKPSRV